LGARRRLRRHTVRKTPRRQRYNNANYNQKHLISARMAYTRLWGVPATCQMFSLYSPRALERLWGGSLAISSGSSSERRTSSQYEL
ncbi:hypothetical protein GWI33_009837, partial [Rhynchophorus ferrugineus]